MNSVDNMTPEMRELVKEYGLHIVDSFRANGVTKPGRIRHLIETVLNEMSPVRGSFSRQGIRTEVARSAQKVE